MFSYPELALPAPELPLAPNFPSHIVFPSPLTPVKTVYYGMCSSWLIIPAQLCEQSGTGAETRLV